MEDSWGRRCFPGAWIQPSQRVRPGVRQGWPVLCSRKGRAMPGRQQQPAPGSGDSLGSHPGPEVFPTSQGPTHESSSSRNTGRWASSFLWCYRFGNRTEESGSPARAAVRGCGGGWATPGLWELAEAGTQKSSWSDCRSCLGGGLLAGERAGSRSSRGHSGIGST